MRFSALQGAAAGAAVTGAAIALILRPAGLAPRAAATPGLDSPAATTAATFRRNPAPAPAPANPVVYVAGAVAHPGVYALRADARAIDAVARAGGLTHDADAVGVNLAAHVADGDEIAVPHIGDAAPRANAHHRARKRSTKGTHRGRHRRAAADSGATAPVAIDLNTAGESALATVPGIGATLASRIVAFRAINGPFASVDGLADVSGVTPSRFEAIAPFLTVGRP